MGLINLRYSQPLGDERGSLVAIEVGRPLAIPFEVKRVYYIYGSRQGVSRGFHAHRNLHRVAICVAGSCRMVLDNGATREEAWLESPDKGLLIESMMSREMHDLSPDCELLVLASERYDEADHIRSYDDFIGLAGTRVW